jgi:predicted transcriptional regulator
MENFSYQRMKKFVEKLIGRKLTLQEYNKFKIQMQIYVGKGIENGKLKYDDKATRKWYYSTKRGKKLVEEMKVD